MPAHTFLFTDIEGSTRLWDLHPQAMRKALSDHDELTNKIVEAHSGKVFKHTGDGVLAVFGVAADALSASADLARRIGETVHPDIGPLKIRIAVHTGEAEERDDDYFGPALNRTSRLLSVAHGGQILVSLVTERMAGEGVGEGISFRDLGEHRLRDLARSERIYQMDVDGLPVDLIAEIANRKAVALRWENVNVDRRRVRVRRAATEVGGRLVEGEPKTHEHRTVIVPRHVLPEQQTKGRVFTAPKGGPLRSANFRKKVWLPAVAEVCSVTSLSTTCVTPRQASRSVRERPSKRCKECSGTRQQR